MGETTNISWTGHTWNPWQGCTKVSPGCAHCYMYRDKKKYGQDPTTVVRSKPPTFNKPLGWKEPALVFTCSWSDWFHEDADAWRDEAWAIVKATPHLTYQILTKRPERILEHLPADWGEGYANVWLGTSVENQHFADIRIPLLLRVPAVVRFLSCEPLLGPIDLYLDYLDRDPNDEHVFWWHNPKQPHPCDYACSGFETTGLHWVIVGGESGPGFRVMDHEWARSIRDQCIEENIPYFFKQSSGLHSETGKELDGQRWEQMPAVGVAA
jgi:protein gp37